MKICSFKTASSLAIASAVAIGAAAYAPFASAACATWGCGNASVTHYRSGPDGIPNDYVHGSSKDIKTDGYCVFQRLRRSGQSWLIASNISGSRACTSSYKNYAINVFKPFTSGVRLYRGDGRYLTLWGPK
jgi:hypothetical protein